MSGIEEKMVLEFARNKIWQDAFYSLTTNYNMVALTHYAKLLGYSVDSLRSAFTTACKYPNECIVPILEKNKLYSVPAEECGRRASILFRSDMPLTASTVIAGLKLATGGVSGFLAAVAGYGKAFLTGLGYAALVGAVIIGAIMGANFIAESWGTYGADDPIEPTCLGDPEKRAAWEAEQAAHVVIYGDMRATIDGIDVTDDRLVEPKYLYREPQYTPTYGGSYYLSSSSVIKDTGESIFVDGREVRSAHKILGVPLGKDQHSVGGPYHTYGQICDAFAKKRDYPEWETFNYKYYYGDKSFEVVDCGRERL